MLPAVGESTGSLTMVPNCGIMGLMIDTGECPGSGRKAQIAPLKPPYRGACCPSCGRSVYVKVDGTISAHRLGQAQDSLTDQVMRVWKLALERGEYDAADWIRRTFPKNLDNHS